MSLRVLHPGYGSRVVDAGRPGTRALGVPLGGAADRRSLALGNALVDNEPDAAALEIALAGPRLRAEADLACVVFGAPFDLYSDQTLCVGKTFMLPAGTELHIAGTQRGLCGYLCVRGGLRTPVILGSRSGLEPIRAGDVLPCDPGEIPVRYLPELDLELADAYAVHAVPGPQASRSPSRAESWSQNRSPQVPCR
jgi:allophanate hydrolase subunit 2